MRLTTFNMIWIVLMCAVIAFNVHYLWTHY
jgi:hypothetical protein